MEYFDIFIRKGPHIFIIIYKVNFGMRHNNYLN